MSDYMRCAGCADPCTGQASLAMKTICTNIECSGDCCKPGVKCRDATVEEVAAARLRGEI